jgi:hypothetical protein
MLRAIVGLSAAYVVTIAVLMSYTSSPGSEVSGVLGGQAIFSIPMMLALVILAWAKSIKARGVVVAFQVGYFAITFLVFASTFIGEHDAQYQLALLVIPIFGFIGVAAAGLIAAFLR